MYRIFFIIILLLTCSTKLIDNRKNHEIILINIKGKTTSLCIYNELIIIDGDTIKLRSTAANTNFEKPPIKKN